MTWIFDTDGDLVNLDHCESIFVALDGDESQVVAVRDSTRTDGSTMIYEGDEDHCREFMKRLGKRLVDEAVYG